MGVFSFNCVRACYPCGGRKTSIISSGDFHSYNYIKSPIEQIIKSSFYIALKLFISLKVCYNKYGDVMKIGDIVSVPLYIGVSQHRPVFRQAVIVAEYPKKHLGTMYLCEVIPSRFRTCIVEPPPPRFQPDYAHDSLQRWQKRPTEYNAFSSEAPTSDTTTTYQKRTHERNRSLTEKYDPMIKELGLDPSIKRSLHKLRSIAQFRGFDPDEIEEGIYRWL